MVRRERLPLIRAVAQAALQQNKLTPYAYDDVVQWIECMEQEYDITANEDMAIRQASDMMIRRSRQAPLPSDQPEQRIWGNMEAL